MIMSCFCDSIVTILITIVYNEPQVVDGGCSSDNIQLSVVMCETGTCSQVKSHSRTIIYHQQITIIMIPTRSTAQYMTRNCLHLTPQSIADTDTLNITLQLNEKLTLLKNRLWPRYLSYFRLVKLSDVFQCCSVTQVVLL